MTLKWQYDQYEETDPIPTTTGSATAVLDEPLFVLVIGQSHVPLSKGIA